MNFKKFISGVSALTIAASAFAGMAVTASAATQSITGSYSNNAFSWIVDGEDAVLKSNGSSAYNKDYSVTVSNPDDNTDSVTLKTHIDQWRNGSSDNRDTLLSSGILYFCQSALKTSNTGSVSSRYLVVAPTKDGTFTCDVETKREVGNNNYDEYFYGTEIANDATSPYTASADKQLLKLTNNASGKISYHMTGGKTYLISTYSYYGTNQGIYISNLKYTDDKVPTSLEITGVSTVTIGSSENYTVTVLDQYGDEYETDAAVSVVASAATGVSYSNGTLTADNTAVSGSTVTLTASATVDGKQLENTKVVTLISAAGYVINTTPYALVSVDGGAAINSGFDGVVNFATSDYTGASHTVVISKPGYTTRTENLTLALNETGTYKLDCSVGSYYEDFSQVNDNMNQTDVAIGNGSFYYEGGTSTSATVTLPESVNADGSVITVAVSSSQSRNGYLDLGDALGIYLRMGSIRESSQSVDSARVASGYDIVKMYLPNTDNDAHRPVLYVNGIKNSATLVRKADSKKVFNSITVTNAGNTPRVSIDYILVEPLGAAADTEPTATVIIDGTSTSYFKGTTVTIPAAAEGYEWHDANDNVVSAGDMVVSENLTLTAVAVQPEAEVTEVSYNKYPSENTAANDQDITAAKVLVTVTGSINKLGLKYSADGETWSAPQYAGAIQPVITGGSIVLGAIVPGLVELTEASFKAVVD